jgi:C4-dicarboxylate transporter DctM subunit
MLTPPLGVNLFVANSLREDTRLNDIIKAVIPMLLILIVDLVMLTYIPALSIGLIKIFNM